MNVDISIEDLRAQRVWYDASTGKLVIQAKDFVNGIDFDQIPEEDFESIAPVTSFSVRHKGATVICHHRDGKENLAAERIHAGSKMNGLHPKPAPR